MFIPVLNTSGKQIAWIDHLKLGEESLFRAGERVYCLTGGGTLAEVALAAIDSADFIDVAANDE